jgi:putative ABC transport system permease protein
MKLSEHVRFSWADLREMKLRAALTTFGVTVGIGALVAMIGFGQGLQKNVTEGFQALDLLNSVTVLPGGPLFRGRSNEPDEGPKIEARRQSSAKNDILDDEALRKIEKLDGVEAVFPDIRFPAIIHFRDSEEFRLVQVLPAKIASSKLIKLAAGKPFVRDDEDAAIIGKSLLRDMNIPDAASAIGGKIRISSLAFDFGALNPLDIGSILRGEKLPFKTADYEFVIVGVAERLEFSGPTPVGSDILVPPGAARGIERLPFTNIWDLFRVREGRVGYSAVDVRLVSPAFVDSLKSRVREMGFRTFALIDQFNQLKTSFIYMDMVLAAVGMIAIFVAALGIVNTMVMSILERYGEIGIMKAVGASTADIKRIFFFESGMIGLAGGLFGLGLGWAVSRVINRVVNFFLAKQGLPEIDYFHFPFWLLAGAVLFAVGVSLVSGIYPALRAAKVDPVVALRHE